jgi:hypothetical protein
MRLEFRSVVLLCVIAVLTGRAAFAQTTGSVRGTVKDTSGAVVPHATIILRNVATAVQRDAVTDDQGHTRSPCFRWANTTSKSCFPAFCPIGRQDSSST